MGEGRHRVMLETAPQTHSLEGGDTSTARHMRTSVIQAHVAAPMAKALTGTLSPAELGIFHRG